MPKIPHCELRYYADKPTVAVSEARKKGVIVLDPSDTVAVENDSNISVVTKSRTYYLRADVPIEASSGAQARISAGQWLSALEAAIEELRAHRGHIVEARPANANKGGGKSAAAALYQEKGGVPRMDVALQDAAPNLQQLETPDFIKHMKQDLIAARRSEVDKLKRADPGLYAPMWVTSGLDAYDAILAHFGPVQTDCSRVLAHIELNVEQMLKQLQAFDSQAFVSYDAALREQRTMAVVLDQLHTISEERKGVLTRCCMEMQRDAVRPMRKVMADMSSKLESIVKYHANSSKDVVSHRKILEASLHHIRWLETKVEDNPAVTGNGSNRNLKKPSVVGAVAAVGGDLFMAASKQGQQKKKTAAGGMLPSASIEKTLSAKTSNERMIGKRRPSLGLPRRGSAKAKVDFGEELDNAKLAQVDVEEALVQCEKRHSVQMVAALDSLEELERTRLKKLKKVLLRAAQAEKRMLEKTAMFLSDDTKLFSGFAEVDPAEDIKTTSEKLMLSTKSTLPTLKSL